MRRNGIAGLPWYLGIDNLDTVATRADRVCVLNILGGESRLVTPVSHVFSGGNVVFGTSPGRSGQVLATSAGDIPVYNTVLEGLRAGHSFDTGVVYLPPAGVRDGVAELIRVNPELKKIVIVTEKIAVHDAREIRAMAQGNGIDVIGGNCLGVADSWNRVRIGGALGGDSPDESLIKGSVAVFSNSGGFTTTIARYMATAGWGTTTLVSSGKDVYIQYSARDFSIALHNDVRSKAAVLYAEPGGYYEEGIDWQKPVVACVVGRWKSRLTRPVGHAGAMAGEGDAAEDKERWFLQAFGTDGIFTEATPHATERGALVTNIADIPAALTAVMALNGTAPDFAPSGSLTLKPWIANDQGLSLPAALALPVVQAPEPYGTQIAALAGQIGAVIGRQTMKDRSGATQMDETSQVTSIHGHSVLDLALQPVSTLLALPLTHELAGENARHLIDVAMMAETDLDSDPILTAADVARDAGNAPNAVLAVAAALAGPGRINRALECARALITLFAPTTLRDGTDAGFDLAQVTADDATRRLFAVSETDQGDPRAGAMLDALAARGARSVFVDFLRSLGAPVSRDAVLAAVTTTLVWGALRRKRVSRLSAEMLPWYLRLYGVMIAASVSGRDHRGGQFCSVPRSDLYRSGTVSDLVFLALTGRSAGVAEARHVALLTGLLISNGPGAISAQGAKGAVSADGPQTPERVQINKAMMGFLTHSGYSHGGNGFEGIAFLLDQFADNLMTDPADPDHGLDLTAMATRFANSFKRDKAVAKDLGREPRAIPGINHPVFRGLPVNIDPRVRFVTQNLAAHGEYNVFLAFYDELVLALKHTGATPNVFCVNVDAVIAGMLLGMLWDDYRSGILSKESLETAAFTTFLFGRMIGAVAEIDDHLNRGRNMDTRTPVQDCRFVM